MQIMYGSSLTYTIYGDHFALFKRNVKIMEKLILFITFCNVQIVGFKTVLFLTGNLLNPTVHRQCFSFNVLVPISIHIKIIQVSIFIARIEFWCFSSSMLIFNNSSELVNSRLNCCYLSLRTKSLSILGPFWHRDPQTNTEDDRSLCRGVRPIHRGPLLIIIVSSYLRPWKLPGTIMGHIPFKRV